MTGKKPRSESGKVFPWFRVFASDFLTETGDLTPSEAGVYIKLLAIMHLHAEPIVDDIGRLARRVGADIRVFRPARAALIEAGLIILKDGKLWSALSEGELEHITARSQIARSNVATRHQKGKQNQASISTDVDKTRAGFRDERLEDQFPPETDPSTSRTSGSDDAPARDGAGSLPYRDDDEIMIEGVGLGWVVRSVSRRPHTLIAEYRLDDAAGSTVLFLMTQQPDRTFTRKSISRAQADQLPTLPGENDHDATA